MRSGKVSSVVLALVAATKTACATTSLDGAVTQLKTACAAG